MPPVAHGPRDVAHSPSRDARGILSCPWCGGRRTRGSTRVARARRPAGRRGRRRPAVPRRRDLGFGGGFLGVSIFFTLSGFLITSLLLVEHESSGRHRARALLGPPGPPDPARRAARARRGRALRPHRRRRPPGRAASRRRARARSPKSRTGASCSATSPTPSLFSAPSPVQHFWSLAIEEQFYLVFPLIVVARRSRSPRGASAARCVVVVALALASTVPRRAAVLARPRPVTRVLRHRHPRGRAARRRAARDRARRPRPARAAARPRSAVAGVGTVALALLLLAAGCRRAERRRSSTAAGSPPTPARRRR